jgi:hypothetical protein
MGNNKDDENEIGEIKEEIISLLATTIGRKGLDIEEIIKAIESRIEYLNYNFFEKALNELIHEKKVWVSIKTTCGKWVSHKTCFSPFPEK